MKRIPFFKDVGHLSGVLLLPCFNDKFGINTFFFDLPSHFSQTSFCFPILNKITLKNSIF